MTSKQDRTKALQEGIAKAFGLESTLDKLAADPESITLVKFLEARLRDDEALALNAFRDYGDDSDTKNGPEWSEIWSGTVECGRGGEHIATGDSGLSRHIVQHDPARVLREVAAKRELLDRFASAERSAEGAYCNDSDSYYAFGMEEAVRIVATAYSHHKDFNPEWSST